MKQKSRIAAAFLLVLGGLAVFWLIARPARGLASAEASYRQGNLSGTLAILEQSNEKNVAAAVLAANCLRELGKVAQCRGTLQLLQSDSQTSGAADLVLALLRIQNGQIDTAPRVLIETLQSAGAAGGEAWNAVVSGLLARQEFDVAAELLDEWQAVDAASPVLLHLRHRACQSDW